MDGNATRHTEAERFIVLTGLRWSVRGVIGHQAAVKLLALSANGRHVRPGVAWVRPCVRPGRYWLDADALAHSAATRSGDEQRVLTLAARLVTGDSWARHRIVQSARRAAA